MTFQFSELLLLVLSLLMQTSLSIPPILKSSVDGYKTVCPGEAVHFTCIVQTSNSLTWRSDQYIGNNTVIEFNRNFDRLGDGKSTSLTNRETTLLQLASLTNEELEATLRIVIDRNVENAFVTCANDVPQSKQQTLLLAEIPEAPVLVPNVANSTELHYFSLRPPPNANRVDINFYNVTIIGSNSNTTLILSNYTNDFTIPPSLYHYTEDISVEVVAVDRCGRQSPASANIIINETAFCVCKDLPTPSGCVSSGYHCQVYNFRLFLVLLMILLHAF